MVNLAATQSNLRKACFRNIRTALAGNVADVGNKVYSSYPLDDVSLPIIIIDNAAKQPSMITTTAVAEDTTISVIRIYSKTSEKLDVYADEVDALLRAYYSTFKTYNLYLGLDSIEDTGNSEYVDINNNRSHVKTMAVTLKLDI